MSVDGMTVSSIAKELSMKRTTVSGIVSRFRRTGYYLKSAGRDVKESLSLRNQKKLLNLILENRYTSKQLLLDRFKDDTGITIYFRTLHRYMNKMGLRKERFDYMKVYPSTHFA